MISRFYLRLATARLAFRNAFRHRTRSTIAILAIAFGVITIMLAGGFIEWIFWAIREAAIQTGLGHVQIVRHGYRESGTADPFAYLLPENSPALSAVENSGAVTAVAPRLNFAGLISHGDITLSFIGEGVVAKQEKIVSGDLQITQGSDLADDDANGIIVGAGLAGSLGIRPGDQVVLLATSASGSINAVDAYVRGLFLSEVKAYDEMALRTPILLARRLLKVKGSHSWAVALDSTDRTQSWIDEFRERLKAADLEFIPWFELADFYNKSVTLLSSQMVVVRIVIGLIILLSISNVLVMSVLERTGEIGTLMAMGTRRSVIVKQFIWEGLLLGVTGAMIGVVVGLILARTISAIGIPMPPPPGRQVGYSGEVLITWQLTAGALSLAVLATVFASLYPAWRAARLNIVDALRHNR